MKNGNKEVRLVYRKLNDPFFIINKPVNWTLKEKKEKTENDKDFASCYKKCVKKENEPYKNVLKRLSNVEKNAFLYTNSTSLCYNNFRYSLNQEKCKATDDCIKKTETSEKETVHKNGNNKFIESYYVESLLKNDNDTELFYPYKLPIYMSGLIICCSDFFIYKQFLRLINETKVIKKYRCLIKNPWVFVDKHTSLFTQNEKDDVNHDFFESKTKRKNNSEFMRNNEFQQQQKMKMNMMKKEKENEKERKKQMEQKEQEEEEENEEKKNVMIETVETPLHIQKKTRYIKWLIAQKKANDIFPNHNFYDNSLFSKSYWNYLTDLEIEKWKNENDLELLKKQKNDKERLRNMSLGRKGKIGLFSLDIYEENEKKQISEQDHFLQVFLKKSEPVKSLNTVLTHIFNNNDHQEFYTLKKRKLYKKGKKEKKENWQVSLSSLYNFNFRHMWNVYKNKMTFPLSLFFNEGNFYRLEEQKQKNSFTYSMIYKIYNYKKYLQKKKLWVPEKHEHMTEFFENLFLVDFIVLDQIKPDTIRFFFSEMKTPLMNDTLFDINKKNFKKDIINQAILEQEYVDRELTVDSTVDIFGNMSSQDYEQMFHNNIQTDQYEKKCSDYIINTFKSNTKAFSLPDESDTFCETQSHKHCDGQYNIQEQKKMKIQFNNYFVQESENPKEKNTTSQKDHTIKATNICLELYHLEFCDPISNEYIKIENSLPNGWF